MFQVIYEGIKDYYPHFRDSGTVKTTSLTLRVSNLYPGTKYTFAVIAATHCGKGKNSTIASGQTLMDGMLLHYSAGVSHKWRGQGRRRPGENGAEGVREAGEEGAGSGRKRGKLRNIAQYFAIEKKAKRRDQQMRGENWD